MTTLESIATSGKSPMPFSLIHKPNSDSNKGFHGWRTVYSTSESLDNIPVCRTLDHTMSLALDLYVCQKLPTQELMEAIACGMTIEIHGLLPGYLEHAPDEFGVTQATRIPWDYRSSVKEFNNIRPTFYRVERGPEASVFVVVPFGQDYLRHYAALIRHFISMNTTHFDGHLSVTRYPQIEVDMADLTGLAGPLVRSGDTVVLGYASELHQMFLQRQSRQAGSHLNQYYSSHRLRIGKRTVNFLGVKYSYWGSIAKGLASRICELGAREIIYSAKLGTLGSEAEIYRRVFSPSSYYVFDHLKLKKAVRFLGNPFLERFPSCDTGAHASVPTVMEETFTQREKLEEYGIQTIDNEIAQIAETVMHFNQRYGRVVSFFALHFATDYLRRKHEKLLLTAHDLSRNRSGEATRQKQAMLETIATLLGEYLEST